MKIANTLLLAVCLFAISGCVKKEYKKVKVQYINASYNSPYVSFYLLGDELMSLIGYTTGTNSHTTDLEDGQPLRVEVKDPASGNVLTNISYADWVEGAHYTAITYGDYANVKTAFFGDSTLPASAGKFKMRFMHFSPDAPALDIVFNGQVVDSNRVFYGTDSLNAIGNFVELPQGPYSVQLKEHNGGQVLVDIPTGLNISDSRILDVFATGTIANTTTHHISLGWLTH